MPQFIEPRKFLFKVGFLLDDYDGVYEPQKYCWQYVVASDIPDAIALVKANSRSTAIMIVEEVSCILKINTDALVDEEGEQLPKHNY